MEKRSITQLLNSCFLKPLVTQLCNKNQFVVRVGNWCIFQSYDSIIALHNYDENKTYIVKEYINYSKTTSKHLYIFLRHELNIHTIYDLPSLKKAIKNGLVELVTEQ